MNEFFINCFTLYKESLAITPIESLVTKNVKPIMKCQVFFVDQHPLTAVPPSTLHSFKSCLEFFISMVQVDKNLFKISDVE